MKTERLNLLAAGLCGGLLLGGLVAGCRSYEPRPIDWAAEARAWTDATNVVRLASCEDAALVARIGNPGVNELRLKCAGSDRVARETGWWDDPEFDLDLNRIVQSSQHPFLMGSSLTFAIPLSGAPKLDARAAEGYAAADALAVRVAEADLAADAGAAYHRLAAAQEREAALRAFTQDVKLARARETAARLAESGEVRAADVSAVRRRVHDRLHGLHEAERETDAARAELRKLLGLAPGVALEVVEEADADEAELEAAAAVATNALAAAAFVRHPRVQERLVRLGASEAALEAEIRRQYPDLKIGPGFSHEEGQGRVGIVLGTTVPLWNRNRKAIAEAEGRRDEERLTALQTWRGLVQEAAAAQTRLRRMLDHPPSELPQLAELEKLVEAGELDTLGYLSVREEILDAQLAELDWTRDLRQAVEEMKRFRLPERARSENEMD